MPSRRAPLTMQDLEFKYKKSAFFINRGMQRIFTLEDALRSTLSRLEATEKTLLYLLGQETDPGKADHMIGLQVSVD